MSYRVLRAGDATWRPSNQMGVLNTDLARQLGAETLGARLWRLRPGQASTRHRHLAMTELYVVLEGRGRIRVGDDVHTLEPLSAVLVEPPTVRQPFNDTDADQLWLIVGAPPENANTLEMTPDELAWIYPDGPKALPPEIEDAASAAESDVVEALILDLLEWIGPDPRPYPEVLEAWRTSCPRLPVWEDATDRGFIARHHEPGRGAFVSVSPAGAKHLQDQRPQQAR